MADMVGFGQVIEKFQSGVYNTMVATCIGEEGLDIGDVDLIVCYDSNASPIRMVRPPPLPPLPRTLSNPACSFNAWAAQAANAPATSSSSSPKAKRKKTGPKQKTTTATSRISSPTATPSPLTTSSPPGSSRGG